MTTTAISNPPRHRPLGAIISILNEIRGHDDSNFADNYIRRRPSFSLSITGGIYCAMILFMGLAAVSSQANLLFGVFGMMIGILIIGNFLCRLVLSRLRISRVLPDHVSVGQNATITYRFQNAKRFWPTLSIRLSELEGSQAFVRQVHAYLLHAAAKTTAEVTIEAIPKRRGLHKFSRFQIASSFPFGFIHRALNRRQEDSILIYPAIAQVSPKLLALCRSAERGGASMQPRANGNDEFFGVKEFRPGQNPRWIHWKRSARTGTLIAREMAQISPPQLLIFVDTYIGHDQPGEIEANRAGRAANIERSIAMAASLAREALGTSMSVGLVIWNNGWTTIAPHRGKRHCHDLLAAIATAPINREGAPEQLLVHGMRLLRQSMTPVVFTSQNLPSVRSEMGRTGMLVIDPGTPPADNWFKFDPAIDFSQCIPADQAPKSNHSQRPKH